MLLAVDLKTGHHLWEQGIPTDVISAPVAKGDNVYITCFDGTAIAFDVSQGKVLWKKKGKRHERTHRSWRSDHSD